MLPRSGVRERWGEGERGREPELTPLLQLRRCTSNLSGRKVRPQFSQGTRLLLYDS